MPLVADIASLSEMVRPKRTGYTHVQLRELCHNYDTHTLSRLPSPNLERSYR
jgi:hypothetical protein